MSHALGCYFAPTHGRQSDRDYIAALQPPVIRLLDCDVQQIADAHALAPDAIIAPRTWSIDDNNGAALRALMADPVGAGRDHAQQYRGQSDRWRNEAAQRGLRLPPTERVYFSSTNEPNQGGTPERIAAYTVAFLNRCTELGIRAAAPCLGVGWPGNDGTPDNPPDWTPYAGIVEPIKRGNHWLQLHEYFYKSGPQDGWRWLAGRHLQCPFDVPILLGEVGIDNYVDAERWRREGGNRGWKGNVTPAQYGDMLEYHLRGSDTRVVAALPFITDYRDRGWESFDTSDAHGALLARKDRMVPQAQFGKVITPPVAPPILASGFGYTQALLNVRGGPGLEYPVLEVLPLGVPVAWTATAGIWLNVAPGRWVHSGWVAPTMPVVQPPVVTPPAPEKWQRSLAFTQKWEGQWADNPADPGGATMKGVTLGTYTRWRQMQGQPVPTKEDLRAISDAEVVSIFREWYWIPSGAAMLPFPDCLAVFDTAIIGGVERARQFVAEVGTDYVALMARRLDWHTRLIAWPTFGAAWTRRCADLLREGAKP